MTSSPPPPDRAPGAPIQVLRPAPGIRIGPPRASSWRGAFDRRRGLVAVSVVPIAVLLFADAPANGSVDELGEWVLVGLLGVLSALVWATFVPRRGGGRAMAASPCAALTALYPLLAVMALGGQPMSVGMGVLATALLVWGLAQRVRGAGACAA